MITIRPARKLYTPIDRIPPLYPPPTYAEERDIAADTSENPAAQLPAAHRRLTPPIGFPPAYPTYTSYGLKSNPPAPKGVLLDLKA